MTHEQDIEKLLAHTPAPTVVPGPHRARLKTELLSQASRRETKMPLFKTMLSTPKRKIAFACCAAMFLVATAWGGEKAYKKIASFFAHESVIVDTVGPETIERTTRVTNPDGTETLTSITTTFGSTLGVSVGYGPEDPSFTDEKTKQQFEEMKGLVAQKKYKFLKTFMSSSGEKQYVYSFTLADGERFARNFICPLEQVASWDEYRQKKAERLEKTKERFRQRNEATKEAIAAGRVRFVNALDIEVHICKDPDSGKELRVQRVVLPNGQELAAISPYPIVRSVGTRSHSTSWQEHLTAIDNGTRELIEKQITKLYMYEATLADGSTAKYGSGLPPEKEKLEKQ